MTNNSSNWQVSSVVFHVHSCYKTSQDKKNILPLISFLRVNKIFWPVFVFSCLSCIMLSFVSLQTPQHHLFFSWRGRNKQNHQLSCLSHLIDLESFLKENAFFDMEMLIFPFIYVKSFLNNFKKNKKKHISYVR